MKVHSDQNWKLFARALDILEGRSNGHGLPIIRKLACRGFAPAVSVLSDYVSEPEAVRLLRKAAQRGDAISAYNLAIAHRNRGKMHGYRSALAKAAKSDGDADDELRCFKTRFRGEIMRRFGRLAPDRN